jgi:hypothetical protein
MVSPILWNNIIIWSPLKTKSWDHPNFATRHKTMRWVLFYVEWSSWDWPLFNFHPLWIEFQSQFEQLRTFLPSVLNTENEQGPRLVRTMQRCANEIWICRDKTNSYTTRWHRERSGLTQEVCHISCVWKLQTPQKKTSQKIYKTIHLR